MSNIFGDIDCISTQFNQVLMEKINWAVQCRTVQCSVNNDQHQRGKVTPHWLPWLPVINDHLVKVDKLHCRLNVVFDGKHEDFNVARYIQQQVFIKPLMHMWVCIIVVCI